MALHADTLLDRLYLKSQITRWRLLAIVFGVIAVLVMVQGNSTRSPIKRDYIARISLEGFIMDDQKIYTLIDDVADDPNAKAMIVWLDTPGGSAVGGEELYLRLRKAAAQKPVVAVMRSVAASAGYMIALGADHIVAREGTITGSIGVLVETIEAVDLARKFGIEPVIVKSAPLKGTPNPLEKTSPETLQVMQDVINDFYNRFVDMVAERRKLPRPTVITLADGRVYSGRRALDYKLIDALGGEDEAVNWLETKRQVKPDLEIQDITPEEEIPLMERLLSSVTGNFFQKSRIGLDGLIAVWHPQLH